MGEDPLVTVCIATYNGEDFLNEAVESVLSQTYEHIEVIIFDNHSTDGTPEVYGRFDDARIRIVRHPKNLGSLGNFNKAIKSGKGDLIAVYHDDDMYDARIIERQVRVFKEHEDVQCCYVWYDSIDEDGAVIGTPPMPSLMVDRPLAYEEALSYVCSTMMSPYANPSLMARRSAFEKAGEYDESYPMAGDVDMNLRLTRVGEGYIIGERLLHYRHTKSQASIRYTTTYTDENQLFGLLDDHLKDADISPSAVRRYEANRDWDHTIRAINLLAKGGDVGKARPLVRRSITWRRMIHIRPVQFAISIAMLIAVYVGLGGWLARRINDRRWREYLKE